MSINVIGRTGSLENTGPSTTRFTMKELFFYTTRSVWREQQALRMDIRGEGAIGGRSTFWRICLRNTLHDDYSTTKSDRWLRSAVQLSAA